MNNITLISTEHREIGNCNSDELLRIVETINPEVIFEEEPNDVHYHNSYKHEQPFNSLEVRTIKKYKVNRDIIHVPVDKPINEFVSLHILDILTEKYKQHNIYNQLIKEHCSLRDKYGFDYLNSTRCKELFKRMKLLEEQIITQSRIATNDLNHFYNLFQQELDLRENTMLHNIYNFNSTNKFEQAIFFIGFAHRESIENKILKIKSKGMVKINWTFYKGKENKTSS